MAMTACLIRMIRTRRMARQRDEPSTMVVLGSKRREEPREGEERVTFGDFSMLVTREIRETEEIRE